MSVGVFLLFFLFFFQFLFLILITHCEFRYCCQNQLRSSSMGFNLPLGVVLSLQDFLWFWHQPTVATNKHHVLSDWQTFFFLFRVPGNNISRCSRSFFFLSFILSTFTWEVQQTHHHFDSVSRFFKQGLSVRHTEALCDSVHSGSVFTFSPSDRASSLFLPKTSKYKQERHLRGIIHNVSLFAFYSMQTTSSLSWGSSCPWSRGRLQLQWSSSSPWLPSPSSAAGESEERDTYVK